MKFSVLLLAFVVVVVKAEAMDSTSAPANAGQKAINEAVTEEEKAAAKAFWAQLTPGAAVSQFSIFLKAVPEQRIAENNLLSTLRVQQSV